MFPQFLDKPFRLQLSFHKIIEGLEETAAANTTGWKCANAKELLQRIIGHPELRYGITSEEQIKDNAVLIHDLLTDLFPEALQLNEIKAVSIPYQGLVFNHTKRFQNILKDAGQNIELNIRDLNEHQQYILSCCIILNDQYGTRLDLSKPMFYDIPTAGGVMRYYRILYNADFMELFPTENSIPLNQEDIDMLMDNYDDIDRWRSKFPPGSYIVKGFGLMSLVDVTVENALSTLKSNLLANYPAQNVKASLLSIFRSMYNIADIRMGFTLFDNGEDKFVTSKMGPDIQSFLLPDKDSMDSDMLLCGSSYQCVIQDRGYFAVSNVSRFAAEHPENTLGQLFKQQGIESFILAPVIKDGVLLGILELVSPRTRELNSVNANKLEIIMPVLVDTIDRKLRELLNRVQAVIQEYYTTLHPSVYWKFRREAYNFLENANAGITYALKEIKFKDVYPLYGQVDISGSSITRNLSVSTDLRDQLAQVIGILEAINKTDKQLLIKEALADLRNFAAELATSLKADTEQNIQHYIETKVHPILNTTAAAGTELEQKIANYFKQSDALTGDFHANRRNYDKTLSLINQKLTMILDNRQAEIQEFFPHYFERFKTDGVEHNMYIGATIAPDKEFKPEHLHRLRLWQLRVIAEMESEQYDLKNILPYQLGVTSLILVFSTPIAIRFRMDEKHFDVDGAYNIRYEVIKKRIDKAHINGTDERITKQGKITIIYSKAEEEIEYKGYIAILRSAGILADDLEHFDVEELQGVSGLKALRIGLIHDQNLAAQRTRSYDDLYKQLDQNRKPAEI